MYTRIPKGKEENILRARGQESWACTMLIGSSHSSSKGTSLGSGKSCSIMPRRIGRASRVIIRWMDFSRIRASNRKQHAEVSMLKRWIFPWTTSVQSILDFQPPQTVCHGCGSICYTVLQKNTDISRSPTNVDPLLWGLSYRQTALEGHAPMAMAGLFRSVFLIQRVRPLSL